MKKLSIISICLILFCFMLSGCAKIVGYRFAMSSPTTNSEMAFSDDYIDIVFKVIPSNRITMEIDYNGEQSRIYGSLKFTLLNKTNDIIIIDWGKVSFTAADGSSGNEVMHQGMKYIDCERLKSPSTIPPGLSITDRITPCYGVFYNPYLGYGYSKWIVSTLPSPCKNPNINFGVFMPIQIGEKNMNYNFMFTGIAYKEKE